MTRADRLGDLTGQSFIHEMLSQRGETPGVPVGVIAPGVLDQRAHLAAAGGRGVANGVSELMGQPERNQLWIETKPLGVRVGDGREVLKTREGDPRPVHHELAGIRRADADHEYDVYIGVLFE